ncbi:hypothetical protein [Micromonospora sp. RTP1Z1]|uniref:hypothetical protein n=1 Tax=Micromonospora sp. RTP1Z1 TaxID=2994043 RepID=UPI0029C7E93D|nr:hypothetical protein [Micromonospora sp. RTP1Z1]
MIIVCDHGTWTIETETTVFTLSSPASILTATAKIPAQRDGDQAKYEEPSRFVWK